MQQNNCGEKPFGASWQHKGQRVYRRPDSQEDCGLQWPCGTLAASLMPHGDQPRKVAMLVLVQVSSMKTRRSGSTWP